MRLKIRNFSLYKLAGTATISLIMLLIAIFIISGCDNNKSTGPGENQPPDVPTEPVPADGATDIGLTITLQCLCLDPEHDNLVYDYYFGTNSTPPFVLTSETYFHEFTNLEFLTTYYWKVVAKDTLRQQQTEGPIWSFSTGNVFEVDNYDTERARRVVSLYDSLVFVADDNVGLKVFIVTDTAGVKLDSVRAYSNAGYIFDVFAQGDRAYLASSVGIQIYDISNFELPDSEAVLGTYDVDNLEERAVKIEMNYAYIGVAATVHNSLQSGLHIVDISDPSAPVLTGSYMTAGVTNDVDLSGNYAFLADSLRGLLIIDISDPANPDSVGRYATAGPAWALDIDNNLAYIACGMAGLEIVDISNPASPSLLTSFAAAGEPKDVYVAGDYAYIASFWDGGLQILDVSTPASPVSEVSVGTQGGAWGIYADARYVYLADTWAGLILYRFAGIQ